MNDELVVEPADAPLRVASDLVLNAMRIAENAHRGQKRKAPAGLDQPDYFLHLAEVAWRLKAAGMPDEVIAAGYLHDILEDCDYTRDLLANELGSQVVADMVASVTEPEKVHSDWHQRNVAYLERVRGASRDVLSISIADKTTNLIDMLRLAALGHPLHSFLSVSAVEQIRKFERLREVFAGRVPGKLLADFDAALTVLKTETQGERNGRPKKTDQLDRYGTETAEQLRILAGLRGLWVRFKREGDFEKLSALKMADRMTNEALEASISERVTEARQAAETLLELGNISYLAGRNQSGEALTFAAQVMDHALTMLKVEEPPPCGWPCLDSRRRPAAG